MKTITDTLEKEIKTEYVSTDKTISELARQYNVSRETLRDRAYKGKWEEQRQKIKLKSAAKFEAMVAVDTAKARADIQSNCTKALTILAEKTLKNAALISDDDTYAKKALVSVIKDIKEMGGFDMGNQETSEIIVRFESMEGVNYEQ